MAHYFTGSGEKEEVSALRCPRCIQGVSVIVELRMTLQEDINQNPRGLCVIPYWSEDVVLQGHVSKGTRRVDVRRRRSRGELNETSF